MVTTPDRGVVAELAATVIVTLSPPLLVAGVARSQSTELDVVHAHPASVVTSVATVPPPAPTFAAAGEMVKVHGAAA